MYKRQKLHKEGFIAYFAGGWVRDFLLSVPSDDIDIVTDASIQEIQCIFPKTIPVGINFGIVVVVEKGQKFEVSTFRKDREYRDGRHPIGIEKASPEEDARRRDFTINGMFYDPLTKTLYDFVEGQKDIKRGIIRAIGNPQERFLEDRLRMIRAVRYACRLCFSIENATLTAILDHSSTLFPSVAIERIWNELSKMANVPNFDMALVTLHRLNLLSIIFPSLNYIPISEIQRRVQFIESFPKEAPVITKILELFPFTTLDEKKELCLYLKLSNQMHHFVQFYHRAQSILDIEKKSEREPFEWAHFYAHSFYPICLKILATHLSSKEKTLFFREHHTRQNRLKEAIQKIQSNIPFLSSHDLRKVGVPNGKHMGKLLREGERLAINESLKTPAMIINRLKKHPIWINSKIDNLNN